MTDTTDRPPTPATNTIHRRPRHRARRHTDASQHRLLTQAIAHRFGPFAPGQARPTWAQVAAVCGVDRKTLWRWRQSAAYRELLREHRLRLAEATRLDAAGLARAAVQHLLTLMLGARSEYVQLEAARALWTLAVPDDTAEPADDQADDAVVSAELLARRHAQGATTAPTLAIAPP